MNRCPFWKKNVMHDEVEVDRMKTAAVQNWPTPHTVKGLLTVGVIQQVLYTKLCPVAASLTGVMKKDAQLI